MESLFARPFAVKAGPRVSMVTIGILVVLFIYYTTETSAAQLPSSFASSAYSSPRSSLRSRALLSHKTHIINIDGPYMIKIEDASASAGAFSVSSGGEPSPSNSVQSTAYEPSKTFEGRNGTEENKVDIEGLQDLVDDKNANSTTKALESVVISIICVAAALLSLLIAHSVHKRYKKMRGGDSEGKSMLKLLQEKMREEERKSVKRKSTLALRRPTKKPEIQQDIEKAQLPSHSPNIPSIEEEQEQEQECMPITGDPASERDEVENDRSATSNPGKMEEGHIGKSVDRNVQGEETGIVGASTDKVDLQPVQDETPGSELGTGFEGEVKSAQTTCKELTDTGGENCTAQTTCKELENAGRGRCTSQQIEDSLSLLRRPEESLCQLRFENCDHKEVDTSTGCSRTESMARPCHSPTQPAPEDFMSAPAKCSRGSVCEHRTSSSDNIGAQNRQASSRNEISLPIEKTRSVESLTHPSLRTSCPVNGQMYPEQGEFEDIPI